MDNNKTRNLLLDAAKRQFIKSGFDSVSMMDIAQESGMSRRTLYSYFESKADVYRAAVERESTLMTDRLRRLATGDQPAQKQILEYVFGRFAVIKDMVDHNGTLRSPFFRNSWTLEHFRKEFDRQEKQILIDIIVQGIDQRVFTVQNVSLTAQMIQNCFRGFEFPFITGIMWKTAGRDEVRLQATRLIYSILGVKEP